MLYLSIDDLANVFICPQRAKYLEKDEETFGTNYSVYSYINKEVLDYGLQMIVATNNLRYNDLYRKFNIVWSEIRKKIKSNFYLNHKLESVNYVNKIYKYLKNINKILYYNIPRTIEIEEKIIQYRYSYIQGIDSKNYILVMLDVKYLDECNSSFFIDIIGSLLEEDLKDIYKDIDVSILRVKNVSNYLLKYIENSKTYVKNYLSYIDNDNVMARNEHGMCSVCEYKSKCKWSVSK